MNTFKHTAGIVAKSFRIWHMAIPYLIKKTFGYIPDNEALFKAGLIVPPEL